MLDSFFSLVDVSREFVSVTSRALCTFCSIGPPGGLYVLSRSVNTLGGNGVNRGIVIGAGEEISDLC